MLREEKGGCPDFLKEGQVGSKEDSRSVCVECLAVQFVRGSARR